MLESIKWSDFDLSFHCEGSICGDISDLHHFNQFQKAIFSFSVSTDTEKLLQNDPFNPVPFLCAD